MLGGPDWLRGPQTRGALWEKSHFLICQSTPVHAQLTEFAAVVFTDEEIMTPV
jgi:hypothetical protein